MKWLVTIQDDNAQTITFEIEAEEMEWTEGAVYFGGTVRPVFCITSLRVVKVENAENAA